MKVEKIHRIENLPTWLQQEIIQQREEEFYEIFFHQEDLYLAVGLGKKHTAGYKIAVENILPIDKNTWEAIIKTKEPKKGQIISQAITFPLSVVRIKVQEDISLPQEIVIKNVEENILKKIRLKEKSSV